MSTVEPNAVRCTISRSGFSRERIFRVASVDGRTYAGAAFWKYCYTVEGQGLSADEPTAGKSEPGFVAAQLIGVDQDDRSATMYFPDGAIVAVPLGDLQHLQERP
jgi:hypothetical protein